LTGNGEAGEVGEGEDRRKVTQWFVTGGKKKPTDAPRGKHQRNCLVNDRDGSERRGERQPESKKMALNSCSCW